MGWVRMCIGGKKWKFGKKDPGAAGRSRFYSLQSFTVCGLISLYSCGGPPRR